MSQSDEITPGNVCYVAQTYLKTCFSITSFQISVNLIGNIKVAIRFDVIAEVNLEL